MSAESTGEKLPAAASAAPAAPKAPPASAAGASPAPTTPAAPAAPPAPAAPEPKPNPLPHLPIPFQGVDFALKGFHADAAIAPEKIVEVAEILDGEGFSLDTITGVDWMAEQQMEVVYDFFHARKGLRAVVRSRVSREKPEIATISQVFPGANWHERETHDFFGIRFLGHPNLTPFLLPEDATFHPLRKDFTA